MIYFIQDACDSTSPIKIGCSEDPAQRLKELQTGSPNMLHVLAIMDGGRHEERKIQSGFSRLAKVGEWFDPHEDLLNFIKRYGRSLGSDKPVSKTSGGLGKTLVLRISADLLATLDEQVTKTAAFGGTRINRSDIAREALIEYLAKVKVTPA